MPTRLLVIFWPLNREADYREGRVRNLSASGLFIESSDPIPPPTVLNLRLVLEDETVDLRGEVVRTVGGTMRQRTVSGMGVRFLEPDSKAVARLLRHREAVARSPRRRVM